MKKALLLIMLAGLFALGGCAAIGERVDASAYERIHRQLLGMESFAAAATVTYISNHNSHVYDTIMHARTSGEYRIEVVGPPNVAGNVTLFDGAMITQFNPNVEGRVMQTNVEAPERLEILLTSFVRNFIRSQNVSITAARIDDSLTTVLEAQIPGDHPYLATQKLWVDNTSLVPVQMIIFGADGAERIVVVFNAFEYNVTIADEMFQVN